MPDTTFKYGDVPVTVEFLTMMRTAFSHQDHRTYSVVVGGPGGPFDIKWDGLPMSHAPDVDRETEEIAENTVEALYMALVPEDFWTEAEGAASETRRRFMRAARRFGDERLRRAYKEVIRRRERRLRLERAHGTGPKDWRPPLRRAHD